MNADRVSTVLIWLVGFILVACILLLISFPINAVVGSWEFRDVEVIDRSYTPSRTSTGVGPNVGGKGVAVTTSTTSESWTLIVKDGEGSVIPVSTSPGNWAVRKAGDYVRIRRWAGCFHYGSWKTTADI